jgi:prevent-host-death family protein
METMGISLFKSQALRIVDQVFRTKENIIITKHGKPIAQIIPYQEAVSDHMPGGLSNTLVFEDDIVSPLGEELWDACK